MKAFHKWHDKHKKAVYILRKKLLRSEKEAKGCFAGNLFEASVETEKLRDVDYFSSYLNTLARNDIYNRLRIKAIREVYLPELLDDEMQPPQPPVDPISLQQLELV